MLLPNPDSAIHKAWLYRLLMAIADNPLLSKELRFKGGTCAAMRSLLDRFSVDLDFDLIQAKQNQAVQQHLETVFDRLGLKIKDKSSLVPQYFLKYDTTEGKRNTIKLEALFPVPASNDYEPVRLLEIDRILFCQTRETMVANKMVALLDRYEKHRSIAARDLYDIHYFLLHGYRYKSEIIEERRQQPLPRFLEHMIQFVEDKITNTIINQDLNYLLPPEQFQRIRKILKQEGLMLLRDEWQRIS